MAITTSCQPRPQPQATGTAATSARNGTATKRATRTRSKVLLGSGLMSGRARAGPRAGGASTVSGVAVRSVVAVIGVPRSLGGSADGWRAPSHTPGFRGRCKYAYVTVGYDTVGCARAEPRFCLNVGKITPAGNLPRRSVRPARVPADRRNSRQAGQHDASDAQLRIWIAGGPGGSR